MVAVDTYRYNLSKLRDKLHPDTAQVGIFVWIKLQFNGTNIFIIYLICFFQQIEKRAKNSKNSQSIYSRRLLTAEQAMGRARYLIYQTLQLFLASTIFSFGFA